MKYRYSAGTVMWIMILLGLYIYTLQYALVLLISGQDYGVLVGIVVLSFVLGVNLILDNTVPVSSKPAVKPARRPPSVTADTTTRTICPDSLDNMSGLPRQPPALCLSGQYSGQNVRIPSATTVPGTPVTIEGTVAVHDNHDPSQDFCHAVVIVPREWVNLSTGVGRRVRVTLLPL